MSDESKDNVDATKSETMVTAPVAFPVKAGPVVIDRTPRDAGKVSAIIGALVPPAND